MYEAFGEMFESLEDIGCDPRCRVPLAVLIERVEHGIDPHRAATVVGHPKERRKIVFGGKTYASLRAIANSPGCKVSYATLLRRLHEGWNLDEAAQVKHVRSNVYTVHGGTYYALKDVAALQQCVVSESCLRYRLVVMGWDLEKAMTTPSARGGAKVIEAFGETFSGYTALSRDPRCVVSMSLLRHRIVHLNMTPEKAATTPASRKRKRNELSNNDEQPAQPSGVTSGTGSLGE